VKILIGYCACYSISFSRTSKFFRMFHNQHKICRFYKINWDHKRYSTRWYHDADFSNYVTSTYALRGLLRSIQYCSSLSYRHGLCYDHLPCRTQAVEYYSQTLFLKIDRIQFFFKKLNSLIDRLRNLRTYESVKINVRLYVSCLPVNAPCISIYLGSTVAM
jgi:hypothetical protein